MAESTFNNLDEGLSQLEAVVKALENSNLSIDEAINKYAEGMKLAVECRKSLNAMTKKVTEVRQDAMDTMTRLNEEDSRLRSMVEPERMDGQ